MRAPGRTVRTPRDPPRCRRHPSVREDAVSCTPLTASAVDDSVAVPGILAGLRVRVGPRVSAAAGQPPPRLRRGLAGALRAEADGAKPPGLNGGTMKKGSLPRRRFLK